MKVNLSGMALVSKPAPSDLESQPLDVYPPDPIQGPPSSIDLSDPKTPIGDHTNVALPTTPATDCFPLPSPSCNSYHSSFSESTSYRSSFSNNQHSAACTSYCSSFSESFGSCSQDFSPQPQDNSCCSHGGCGSTAANRYSRHEPEPREYDHLNSTSYVDQEFEIPVREFHGSDVPSFSFFQESYSTSYTTSCAVRNNLPAQMAAPPRTRLSISHNHNTKNQIPFHHSLDPFSKSEDQSWHVPPIEDPFNTDEWQSIDQVAREQTWADHHPKEEYVDQANILEQQGQVLGEILDVPTTTTGNTLGREL